MLTIDYVVEHFDEFKMPFTAEDHGDEIGHSDLFYAAMTVFGVSVYPFTEENVINELKFYTKSGYEAYENGRKLKSRMYAQIAIRFLRILENDWFLEDTTVPNVFEDIAKFYGIDLERSEDNVSVQVHADNSN